ncbi:hypothetical protein [Undibacterium terreum]|uniref:hypothetical protein n=1 Tax=Undibacterium terreum TaxID=1224302 RepID=UPI001668134C|nr:hypothetical protein [Undibacterium terreum]
MYIAAVVFLADAGHIHGPGFSGFFGVHIDINRLALDKKAGHKKSIWPWIVGDSAVFTGIGNCFAINITQRQMKIWSAAAYYGGLSAWPDVFVSLPWAMQLG